LIFEERELLLRQGGLPGGRTGDDLDSLLNLWSRPLYIRKERPDVRIAFFTTRLPSTDVLQHSSLAVMKSRQRIALVVI